MQHQGDTDMPRQYYSRFDTVLDMRRMAPTKLFQRHSDVVHDLVTCPYCNATGRLNESGLVVEHRLETNKDQYGTYEITDYCTLKIFEDWRDASYNPMFATDADILRVCSYVTPKRLANEFRSANPIVQYVAARMYLSTDTLTELGLTVPTLSDLAQRYGMRRHGTH